jgi:hypothetical protein
MPLPLKRPLSLPRPPPLAAIREQDIRTRIIEPPSPALDTASSLLAQYQGSNGGDYVGRKLRTLLIQAGFVRTEARAIAHNWEPGAAVSLLENLLGTEAYRAAALEHGWPAGADVDQMVAEMRAWAALPDAFVAHITFAALGWVS